MSAHSFSWGAGAIATGLAEVDRCRQGLLSSLKTLLNEYHGVSRSHEYWDLVAGMWLENFTHLTYIAWREVLSGNIPLSPSIAPVILTLDHERRMATDITWHEHLHWAVAELLEGRNSENWLVAQESAILKVGRKPTISEVILQRSSTAKPKVLLTHANFKCTRHETLQALWHWRDWVRLDNMNYPIDIASEVDWTWRKKHSTDRILPPSDFAALVESLMPMYIPVALLEAFAQYRTSVLGLSLHRPQAVFSANAVHGHLTFKLLTAEWREEGTILLHHQHGGGYGLELGCVVEKYEQRVSDKFYSWGWTKSGENATPLSPAMPRARRKPCHGPIVLCCQGLPNVPYRLMFATMPENVDNMHLQLTGFISAVGEVQRLVIRPFPVDFGWGTVQLMRAIAPNATINSSGNILSQYLSARLVVHDYLGTSWLETLGLDIPTVCFYDPTQVRFQAESKSIIAGLHRAGILHSSGRGAGKFIADLGGKIDQWWRKKEVREARSEFVKNYANFSSDWIKEWEREFLCVTD